MRGRAAYHLQADNFVSILVVRMLVVSILQAGSGRRDSTPEQKIIRRRDSTPEQKIIGLSGWRDSTPEQNYLD